MNIVETAQSLKSSQVSNPQFNQIMKLPKIPKPSKNTPSNADDVGTTISNLAFLKKNYEEPAINNLNTLKVIPQVSISLTNELDANNSQKDKNLAHKKSKSFVGKTKDWAGNMWNSIKNIKFKKMFGKAEFKEFRNANGDIVKIPVKKIPLKKKKENNIILKNTISHEQNRIVSTYDGIAVGMYLVS